MSGLGGGSRMSCVPMNTDLCAIICDFQRGDIPRVNHNLRGTTTGTVSDGLEANKDTPKLAILHYLSELGLSWLERRLRNCVVWNITCSRSALSFYQYHFIF